MLQPQKTWNAAGAKIEHMILDSCFILLLSQSQQTHTNGYTSFTFILYMGVGGTIQSLLEQQSTESPHCTLVTTCLAFILSIWSFSPVQRLCWEKRVSPFAKSWNMTSCFFLCAEGSPLRADTCGFHLDWIESLVSGCFKQKGFPTWSWGPWHTSVIETPYKNEVREAWFYTG